MYVNNLMLSKEKLITVTPEEKVSEALKKIEENGLLSIPVSDGEKFYGSISKEKIYTYYYEKCPDKQKCIDKYIVKDMMRTDIPVVQPMDFVEEAAHYLETRSISFVAVEDEYGKFKGIITHYSIFHMFTELFGLNKGKRLAIIAYDIPGQVSKLTSTIAEYGGDVISLVVTDPKSVTDVKEIVIRIRCNADKFKRIKSKVQSSGFKVQ